MDIPTLFQNWQEGGEKRVVQLADDTGEGVERFEEISHISKSSSVSKGM